MLLQYLPRKRDIINIIYACKRLNTVVRFHFSIYEITGPKNEDGIISYTSLHNNVFDIFGGDVKNFAMFTSFI